jgi:Domain of unknown function (DUF4388)
MTDAADELVRIDEEGNARPVGALAAARMQGRAGTFRVMPAPDHVVFMRYTGEDGRRDEEDGAVVRLAGELIAPAQVCDVMAMLVHTRWRGELAVLATEGRRRIFVENGNVVGAATDIKEERIGQVMWRYGIIDEVQHAAIMEQVERGARYGSAAVALEILTREQVYSAVGKQIEEIVFGALDVDDGMFYFLDGFDSDRLVSRHTLSTSMLLMDGVTRMDEVKYFRQRIPGNEWVPAHTDRESPPEDLMAVYELVDGKRDVREIGRLSSQGDFEITKSLYTLCQSGHISVHPPRVEGGVHAMVSTANTALRAIHRQVDRDGKGTLFRTVLSDFANGAGVYSLLFRRAGPDKRGLLDPKSVCANLFDVADGDEELFLKDKLHEYVSFGLFAAGNVLGADAEQKLSHELNGLLRKLQPSG